MYSTIGTHIVQPLYRGYRSLRPRYREVYRSFRAGLRFRAAAATWDVERRRAWQLRQLRRAVRRAYQDTPFYRERLDRVGFDAAADFSFQDYAALPVLEREDVRAAGTALRSRAIPPTRLRQDATGGSSGEPTRIWIGPEEAGWRESAAEHFMRRIGVPRGSRVGYLWGHHLDPVASDRWRDRLRTWLDNARWFECLRLSPETLDAHHRALQAWRPDCIIAYGGALAALAERVASASHPLRYPRTCFVTGAEKLRAEERSLINGTYGKPVHERYGSRDVGLMGFQVAPSRTLAYEIDWANVLLEPENEEGVASVLITKLHADGMPMLRYRLGDLGVFPEGSQPGHPVFLLPEIMGREADRVWRADGSWVHGLTFPHLLKDYDVREFQILQAEDLGVTVRIVPGAAMEAADLEQMCALLESNLHGLPVSIELVTEVERTRALKRRPVVSKVDPARRVSRGA